MSDSAGKPEPAMARAWPHDEPNGWNRNAAKFIEIVQSQPMMWLALTRAKYIELRIDTRDGGFNLYDGDRKSLNPDEVVKAVEQINKDYGTGQLYRSQPPQPTGDVGELVARLREMSKPAEYGLTVDQDLMIEAAAMLESLNSRLAAPTKAEIRPNPGVEINGFGRCEDTDEVVGTGSLHVEQMDSRCFWARLDLPDGKGIVMWFRSKSPIKLIAEWD